MASSCCEIASYCRVVGSCFSSPSTKRASTTVDQPTADLSKVLTGFVSSGSNSTFTCCGAIPLADIKADDDDITAGKKRKAAGRKAGGKKRKMEKGKVAAAEVPQSQPGAVVVRWDRLDGCKRCKEYRLLMVNKYFCAAGFGGISHCTLHEY